LFLLGYFFIRDKSFTNTARNTNTIIYRMFSLESVPVRTIHKA